MWVVERPAVGHVKAPHADAAAPRADRPCLDFRLGAFFAEGGLALEADGHLPDSHARKNRHAVPLVEPVGGDFVSGGFELGGGELVGAALRLLQQEDVEVPTVEDGERPFLPRPN